jgi:hypothetical protein
MTPLEFKAWFDGFSEGIDKVPTQKQWARIKDRIAEIDGHRTEPIFVDRYRPYYPYYQPYNPCGPVWINGVVGTTCHSANSNLSAVNMPSCSTFTVQESSFDGLAAMNALGKYEIDELR